MPELDGHLHYLMRHYTVGHARTPAYIKALQNSHFTLSIASIFDLLYHLVNPCVRVAYK